MSAWNSVLLISRFVSHLLPIFIFQLALNEIKAEILNVVNCNSFIRERKFPLHYKISTTVFFCCSGYDPRLVHVAQIRFKINYSGFQNVLLNISQTIVNFGVRRI